jgi:hemoglobin-like flavoprotein
MLQSLFSLMPFPHAAGIQEFHIQGGVMSLSIEQKELVQTTWLKVMPIADTAASLFYQRLFELDPNIGRLFKNTNMTSQRLKLINMLSAAVKGLDTIDTLLPTLKDLGRNHVKYGVKDEHYASVGEALLWTLKQGLGPIYTVKVADAWTTTYALIADVMRRAAREASAPQPVY